ncbi:hypothetical protein A1O3_05859 [Capronia epimyces CBS 606.96]|uniref:Prokaryotic-type class I peptide chain release factors domain-containing protein n=1 Tax=Capronia epimyces CBS 606.96 TaxID=1182542 RepID=W9YSC3_9EURO|nr:uncharacterized protein A1O3_05859 [Capronia epimyces CBS 606.96]EXJ85184.1 hypothetical protein A1O3_05859 [Capronia epimyces CBS 606.96]
MLRWATRPSASVLLSSGRLQPFQPTPRSYPSRAEIREPDCTAAREWFKDFNALKSLRDIGELTYSRSSGPGGQNVNKVNSKAQLRVPISRLFPLIPPVLHEGILASRYYAQSSSSLVIQADDSRKQQANKETCVRKLVQEIVDIYNRTIPGETSADQKDKVKRLQTAENESRLKRKKLHSSKKQSRSKSNMD